MAYLRVTFNYDEIDRRDLTGPLVIGRSPECDIAVRDILLSRRHCRIEPKSPGWCVLDPGSKNGTTLNNEPLTTARALADGDVVRLGRVKLTFGTGSLAGARLAPLRCPPLRPADPAEALSNSGTFVGVSLLDKSQSPSEGLAPRPEPRAPAAFEREDLYSLLTSLASSSWDSIYEQAKQPRPSRLAGQEVTPQALPRLKLRPRSPIDLSLQVHEPAQAAQVTPPPPAPRRLRFQQRASGWAFAACCIVIAFALTLKIAERPPTIPIGPPPSLATQSNSPAADRTPDQLDAGWAASVQLFAAAFPILW
jgi:predicted component of type VI protein secretion system